MQLSFIITLIGWREGGGEGVGLGEGGVCVKTAQPELFLFCSFFFKEEKREDKRKKKEKVE